MKCPGEANIIFFHTVCTLSWGYPTSCPVVNAVFPPGSSCWVMNYHIPVSSAEDKNAWRYTSTLYIFIVWCLIKVWINFTFFMFQSSEIFIKYKHVKNTDCHLDLAVCCYSCTESWLLYHKIVWFGCLSIH